MSEDNNMVIAHGVITKIFPNNVYQVILANGKITKAIPNKELRNNLTKAKMYDKVLIEFCKCSVAPKMKIAKIFKIKK